jgi:hypothetical protein
MERAVGCRAVVWILSTITELKFTMFNKRWGDKINKN